MKIKSGILILAPFLTTLLLAQDIYFGNDLSYVNQMEDCGAVFKEDGKPKDVYQVFVDHGTDLVRVRLWHNPDWQNSVPQPDGVKSQYSDFEDVYESVERAKGAGAQVMVGFHFSDFWADPGRQVLPKAWAGVANNLPVLKDSVYNYVVKTLSLLNKDGLLPEFVKIGNEANPGMMTHASMNSDFEPTGLISWDWGRQGQLYNAAIKAVRDFTDTTGIKTKIALHCADPKNVSWWYQNIMDNGVTDFDIIGFTYYYSWHGQSIIELGQTIKTMKDKYPGYMVMVVETAYLWTTKNHDELGNIINTPDPGYLPVSPQKQLEYMVDFQREIIRNGGSGAIFWEPAWVSTPCRTPWGKGSSHDHVAFFDPFDYNFMVDGAGRWTEPVFYKNINSPKVTFIVDMSGVDFQDAVYIKGSWSDKAYKMVNVGEDKYSFACYEIKAESSGSFYFLTDTSAWARETVPAGCALLNGTDRMYKVGTDNATIESSYGSCSLENPSAIQGHKEEIPVLEIFPNPGGQNIELRYSEKPFNRVAHIVDVNGVIHEELMLCRGLGSQQFDISGLSPGVYFIRIYSNLAIVNKKFLVI